MGCADQCLGDCLHYASNVSLAMCLHAYVSRCTLASVTAQHLQTCLGTDDAKHRKEHRSASTKTKLIRSLTFLSFSSVLCGAHR